MFKTSEESIEITAQESLFLNAKKLFINIEDTISQYSKQLKTIVEENVTMQIGNELRTSMSCLDTAIQKMQIFKSVESVAKYQGI